jgi:hypothetical protein
MSSAEKSAAQAEPIARKIIAKVHGKIVLILMGPSLLTFQIYHGRP